MSQITNKVEKKLGIKFDNPELLERAMTHRSYLNEADNLGLKSNERLEFLGDAVLQFLTSEYIFRNYIEYPEGDLTNLRSKVVNTLSLAEEAKKLNLGKYLSISKGERETALASNYILADTFESVLGAIYLDKDISFCREYLKEKLFYKIPQIVEEGELKDPKSLYQELAQEKYGITPIYRVLEDIGPDHDKNFVVGVYLESKLKAKGAGSSKRKAQQSAAEEALKAENN